MKKILLLLVLFSFVFANAQTEEEKLTTTLKEFHQALVNKNTTVYQSADR